MMWYNEEKLRRTEENEMKLILEFVLLGIFLVVAFYILYVQGYMIVGSKSARKFIGANVINSFQAVISECNGNMKKVAKLSFFLRLRD